MAIEIFFLNVGRSGSTDIAKYFRGFHEPTKYLNIKATKKLAEESPIYIDSSHYWRNDPKKLVKAFPNSIRIHLIRDGRKVVNSYMNTSYMYIKRKSDKPEYYFYPFKKNWLPIEGFENFTRFEKCCWHWRFFNERIEPHCQYRLRLEDISQQLIKENKGVVNKGKPHKKWTDKEKQSFDKICGKLNKKYGYN